MSKALAILCLILALAAPSAAKDKKKETMPELILRARYVAVVVDPDAGVSLTNPGENGAARSDVEAALRKWGRFTPTLDTSFADLIIVLRKGGKAFKPTIGGVPNETPGTVATSDGEVNIRLGAGRPPGLSTADAQRDPRPTPRTEVSMPDDVFAVYIGRPDQPLDSPPLWRYAARNGLQHPTVPAVEKFRKAIEDAEKAKP